MRQVAPQPTVRQRRESGRWHACRAARQRGIAVQCLAAPRIQPVQSAHSHSPSSCGQRSRTEAPACGAQQRTERCSRQVGTSSHCCAQQLLKRKEAATAFHGRGRSAAHENGQQPHRHARKRAHCSAGFGWAQLTTCRGTAPTWSTSAPPGCSCRARPALEVQSRKGR